MANALVDLSSLTDALVALLDAAVHASPLWTTNGGSVPPFNISVSGSAPDSVREGGDCQLSFYLMHLGVDPALRNLPPPFTRGQLDRAQPLPLVLSYLLTAYAGSDAIKEQQAMGIALRCLADHAIYRPTAAEKATFNLPDDEYTITSQADTLEELSRLWQSVTAAYRLSSVFRVSAALLAPLQRPEPSAPPPDRVGLAVAPAADLSLSPQLFGPALRVSLTRPVPPDPTAVAVRVAPESASAGDAVTVSGTGLATPAAADLYLTALDGTETKVTGWRTPASSDSELRLQLPPGYGAAPGSTPPPGIYLLSVGTDAPARRSPPTTLAVAARVDGVADPPVLAPDGTGLFVVNGAGFTPGAVQLALAALALTPGASPGAGVFATNPAGTRLSFRLPAGLQTGRYGLRIRVSGVESAPSWRIDVP